MITASLFIGAVYCLLFSLCLSESKRACRMEEERDLANRRADRLAGSFARMPKGTNGVPIGLDMTVSTN